MATTRIHAGLTIAVGAVFIPICSSMVGLRVYARRQQGVKLGLDDWTIIAALAFVIGMAVTMIAEVRLHNLAYAAPDPSLGLPDADVAFWPVELIQVPALGLVKLSFVFFYRRIFTKQAAITFHRITLGLIIVIICWTLSFLFALLFLCKTHFSSYWASPTIEDATCANAVVLHNAFSISDVITDFIVIALPVPMIWQLHLSTGRKIGVTAIFSLGALTVAASLVRMVIFLQATALLYDAKVDYEFLCTAGLYWSMIESGLGLCAACLPAQYSLLRSGAFNKAVQSLMSIFSLRSLSQRHSQRSSGELPSKSYAKIPVIYPPPAGVITTTANGPGRGDQQHVTKKLCSEVTTESTIVVTRDLETSEGMV